MQSITNVTDVSSFKKLTFDYHSIDVIFVQLLLYLASVHLVFIINICGNCELVNGISVAINLTAVSTCR